MKTKWGIWTSGVWKPWSAQEEEWCVFGTMVDTRRNDAFLEPWSPQQEEQYFVWNPDQHRRRNNGFLEPWSAQEEEWFFPKLIVKSLGDNQISSIYPV